MPRGGKLRLVATTAFVGALTLASISPAVADSSPSSSPVQPSATSSPETTPKPSTSAPKPDAPKAATEPSTPPKVEKPKQPPRVTVAELNAGKVVLRRGVRGPAVAQVQRRLNILGLLGPVTGAFDRRTAINVARFNEKFRGSEYNYNHALNRQGWLRLVRLTVRPLLPVQCRIGARVLCVSISQRIVRLMVNGKTVMGLDARFGRPGEETRRGTFRIFRKVINDYSTLYRSPMPWSMYFSGGQAIHFSKFFKMDGYWGASHGCVNIRDLNGAINLWKSVPIGTKTVVY